MRSAGNSLVSAAAVLSILLLLGSLAAAFDEYEEYEREYEEKKKWDEDEENWKLENEVYDVVEDVNTNFYEFLEIEPSASAADIRKTYRRLSLSLHPDKGSKN